ncbi:hypothetical protein KW794_01215 [Candidatus Saccharibacteria bacterium]|nr:hypothetical protein [Candidatus Saccharibacteria bacterium]
MELPEWLRNRQGATSVVALATMCLLLAMGGLLASVALTKEPRAATAAATSCNTSGSNGHVIVGPCGYDKGNFSLIEAGSTTPTLGNGDKVVICHRTGSRSNPYVQIPPDVNGVVSGHYSEHPGPVFPATGSDGKWGDIIPPFIYKGQRYQMNWDNSPQGQAIYNSSRDRGAGHGCEIPASGPPGTTTSGTTTGHTTTGQTTTGHTTTQVTTTVHTTTTTGTTTLPGSATTGPSVSVPGQTTTGPNVTVPGQTTTGPTKTVPGKTTTTPAKSKPKPTTKKPPAKPPVKVPPKPKGPKVPAPPVQGFTR